MTPRVQDRGSINGNEKRGQMDNRHGRERWFHGREREAAVVKLSPTLTDVLKYKP